MKRHQSVAYEPDGLRVITDAFDQAKIQLRKAGLTLDPVDENELAGVILDLAQQGFKGDDLIAQAVRTKLNPLVQIDETIPAKESARSGS